MVVVVMVSKGFELYRIYQRLAIYIEGTSVVILSTLHWGRLAYDTYN